MSNICSDCMTREEILSLMDNYKVPVGGQLFVGADQLQYFDSTGKGLANTEWRCWAIQNGNNGTVDAQGKFFVGYDPQDADFDNIDQSFGSKTFTLDVANLPDHEHQTLGELPYASFDDYTGVGTAGNYIQYTNQRTTSITSIAAATTGDQVVGATNTAVEHMPPYIVKIPVEKIC